MTNQDSAYFDKIMTAIILIALIVFAFLLLRPILISVVGGLLLAFIFAPTYKWLYKKTNSKNLSSFVIIILLALIIIIPLWFLAPILITQSLKVIQSIVQIDFAALLKNLFPDLFTPQLSAQISASLTSFTTKVADSITGSLTYMILNFPTMALQFLVVLFTFFYVLRDQDEVTEYIKSLLPFPKHIERKLFEYSTDITKSVLYGTVIIGIIQGLIAGIGFIIFGVPNALFLTLIAMIMGILPILGTPIVWVPAAVYMFIAGNNLAGWGVVVFGVISSTIDNVLRPIFVSKMTKVNSGIVLVSMIGGALLFGFLGFIIGPLVVSYLLIILELYRKKPTGLIIQQEERR